MQTRTFGFTAGGEEVALYRLESARGAYVELLNYGATVRALCVPDKRGELIDTVLGYDDMEGYERREGYLGAFIGRYANRIGGARFSLKENGRTREYRLPENEPGRCLHGGVRGFDKRMYEVQAENGALTFFRVSSHGEEGFPGNLKVSVTYRLTEENALEISYAAQTDMPTVLNLTNHSYFNLDGAGDVLLHTLFLDADLIAETDETFNVTGRFLSVEGTPFDFRAQKPVGRDIDKGNAQLLYGGGYDHNFVLNGAGFRRVALLAGEKSGVTMEVLTDAPGLQFYCGNFLDGGRGKDGRVHAKRSALCLETQNFPDAPNQSAFPSAVLLPGETYRTRTTYAFSAREG